MTISNCRGIRLFCFILFALCGLCSLFGEARAEQAEDTNPQGEGRIWIPRFAFPPADASEQAGYFNFWHRDFSLEYLRYTLYLSRAAGLEITKKNSEFYLRIGGRIYVDFVNYFEDKNDLGPDGAGLRTLQIDADGRFSDKWLYRASIGGLTSGGRFDGSGAYLDDAYVAFVDAKDAWLFGQQDEPFSLEQMTSSAATTFMERALPNALAPGKTVGVSFRTTRNQWAMSAGLFGNDLATTKDGGALGYGFTGRVVLRPQGAGDRMYHLGGSVSYRSIPSDRSVYFRSRPESGLTDVRYVNTGNTLDVDHVKRLGLEAAFRSGPLSLQSEYMMASVDRGSGFDDSRFYGWYVYVSWFLGGGSREYLADEAIFAYPKVHSKWGAVELGARYSMLNLNDGSIAGGLERNLTFGINWYLSRKIRLMANYILVFCDENANDNGTVKGGDAPQILMVRLQLRF